MSPWPSISRMRQARASSSSDLRRSVSRSLMLQSGRTADGCSDKDMTFSSSSGALPLPIDGAAEQKPQGLIEQQPADPDDDDRGVDVGKGEARAPDGDVVAEPDGVADHLGDDDDDDRHRQGDA